MRFINKTFIHKKLFFQGFIRMHFSYICMSKIFTAISFMNKEIYDEHHHSQLTLQQVQH